MSFFSSFFDNIDASNLTQALERLSRVCLVIPVPPTPHPLEEQLDYSGDITELLYAICIHQKQVLLIGWDELAKEKENDWLADEERFNDEGPLYFSVNAHRMSPVFLMNLFRSFLFEYLPEEKYNISILLLCNYNVINEEDMLEVWEEEDVRVISSCRSVVGLKAGSMDKLKDERLSKALLELLEQNIPDLKEKLLPGKDKIKIENDLDESEDEFEKILNDFIAGELEDEDPEDSLPQEKMKRDIIVKGNWREMLDKESVLYQSLEQLGWEAAYGAPGFLKAWRKVGTMEWSAWYEAQLSVRALPVEEKDSVLFDYVEGAAVYLIDYEERVLSKKWIHSYSFRKNNWGGVCLGGLPEEEKYIAEEWIDGEILIVKDEMELASIPLRWIYLPGVPGTLRFIKFQLHRNDILDPEGLESTALSCFSKKGLHDVWAVYQAENIWGRELPVMLLGRLYGEDGSLLAEKFMEISCPEDRNEIVASARFGNIDGIVWKKARYLLELRFNDEVVISAIFEVGKNDVPGIYREDEISPWTWNEIENPTSDTTKKLYADPYEELKELPGMDGFKQRINELAAYKHYTDQRMDKGILTPKPPLHMAFMGNSADRNYEMAKLLGRLLHKLGFLTDGQVAYVNWDKLTKKFSQQTDSYATEVSLTNEINAAQGGILFIDQVALPSIWDDNNGHRNVGEEAWNELMRRLQDNKKTDWILVISGSEQTVRDTIGHFVELGDSIPPQNRFYFADYSQDEWMEIARSYCRKHHYHLTEEAAEALRMKIQEEFVLAAGGEHKSEYIEHLFTNEILEAMALRVSKLKMPTVMELMTIRKEDVLITPRENDGNMQKLNRMVGLNMLKTCIEKHLNMVRMMKWRMDKGMETSMPPLHMVFLGNPGTGKTTVADFIGEIYASMGLLSKGKVIKISRKDLVGQYIGHTEKKTLEYLKRAEGNVLFIDEAYSLCVNENEKDFGHRVIEILLTVLDKDQIDMLVILAGYPGEMKRMLETNPGLPSRFPYTFYFNDYSVDELMQIAKNYVRSKNYFFTPKAFQELRNLVERQYEDKDEYWGNARYIVRLISSQILPAMSERVAALPAQKRENERVLQQICLADIKACDTLNQAEPFNEEEIQNALRKLDALVGLEKVKEAVHDFVTVARYLQKKGQSYFRDEPLRWNFIGNTGTGKSTVAGILGEILRAMHVLNRGNLVELKAENLYNVPDYKVDEIIRNAMKQSEQGLLFVDGDAPMFKNPQTWFNGEELRFKLNSLMMELPGNYAIVIAEQTPYGRLQGDGEAPNVLFEMGHTFYFEDYSPEELMSILVVCLEKRKLVLEPEAEEMMRSYIGHLYENRNLGYANARTMSILSRNIMNHYLVRISRSKSAFSGIVIKEDVGQYVWKNVPVRKKIGFKS